MPPIATTAGDPDHLTRRLMAAAQIGAAALIGFGAILYVAANWDALGKFGQFGLIGSLLALAGVAAALWRPARVPGSLLAFAATGGLLALLGITYQSGADPWTLFALWAALGLPLGVAARHDVVWTAWTLVASTALPMWLVATTGEAWGGAQLQPTLLVWIVAAALAALLSPWTGLDRWIGRTRWAFRLAVSLFLALVATRAVMALWTPSQFQVYLLGVLLIGGVIAALILLKPLDFSLLAISALAADALVISGLWRLFFNVGRNAEFGTFLILGLASAGIVVGTVRLLLSVAQDAAVGRAWQGKMSAFGDLPEGLSRWPTVLLSGFGAVMAAMPFLALYGLFFGQALTRGAGPWIIGAATIAFGAWLARCAEPYGFKQIFALIALVVGQVVLGIGLVNDLPIRGVAFVYLLLAVGLSLYIPARWIAGLHGFAAAGAAIIVLGPDLMRLGRMRASDLVDAWLLPVMLIAIAGAAAVVALTRWRVPVLEANGLTQRAQSFALGWTASALLATMAAAGPTFLLGATVNTSAVSTLTPGLDLTTVTASRVLAIILAVAGIAAYIRVRGDQMTMTGYAVAAVVLVLSYLIPTFAVAVLVLGAMLLAGHRSGAALTTFAALWCLGSFYYVLGIPLTQKALLLVALGLALGIAATWEGLLLPKLAASAAVGWSPLVAAALIATSVGATGFATATSISTNEAVIRNGQRIFIQLAPVDPRSLMQGDFMALRFTLPAIGPHLRIVSRLQAIATVDARGVATIVRVAVPPAPLAAGETAIDLTLKGQWTVATDAFFFKEGTGQRYEAARFGEFRLAKGRPVLIGLADKDLVPIK